MQSQRAERTAGVPTNGCALLEQKGAGSGSGIDEAAIGLDGSLRPRPCRGEFGRLGIVRLAAAGAAVSYAFPPRQMQVGAAAYYVGLSETCFLDRVKAGAYPPGIKEGGVRIWLRDDLDASIERRFGVTDVSHGNVGAREEDPFAARFSKVG